MTPISSETPYAIAQDLLTRQDVGLVGQLCVDDGNVASALQIVDTNTVAGKNVLTALLDASGEIEYAATRGQRYAPQDLQQLTGASLGFLKRITCDIAMMNLYDRRDGQNPPENVVDKYKRAQEFMQQLVDGERVFGDLQNQQAGPASNAFFSQADLLNMRLASAVWPRAFGRRLNNTRGFGNSIQS